MIEVNRLQKQYGDVTAVAEVSFEAAAGRIFGLLGPNGAGKSTTIACISGLRKPSGGSIRVLGHDVVSEGPQSRRRLGVVPQELALYEDLSALENLRYWGAAYGLRGAELKTRAEEVLQFIALSDRAREPVKQFSGGMKRRLNFGCAILHRPQVLLLDEPTAGVDPQSRVRLLEMVRQLVKEGACVLYTTHYMEEAESICDELAIMDHGQIIAQGSLEELRSMVGGTDMVRLEGSFPSAATEEALREFSDLKVLRMEDKLLHLELSNASQTLTRLFSAVETAGGEIRATTLTRPSLETLFIRLTGEELRE